MDLYALPPEEFTAARDVAAKQDKALKALRRPSVSAWIVNTLVRREAGLIEELAALGGELAGAQSRGDAPALRTLGERRRTLVRTVTTRALALAGRDVSPAVRLEVEATFDAALTDPASADAVRSGRLVRALAFAGFGGVDLDGAVAAPIADAPKSAPQNTLKSASRNTPKKPSPEKAVPQTASPSTAPGPRIASLERAALQAQGALDDAARQADTVARALEGALTAQEAADQAVEAAASALEQARAALTDATKAHSSLSGRRAAAAKAAQTLRAKAERTQRALAAAQEVADAARQALDRARRG